MELNAVADLIDAMVVVLKAFCDPNLPKPTMAEYGRVIQNVEERSKRLRELEAYCG